MGSPVLRRWLEAGHDVLVHDPDPARGAAARDAGATTADSPAAVAAAVDVLVTVLPGAAEVADVVPALVPVLRPGSVWLDLTSGDPRTTDRIATALSGRGVATVAAAAGGGPAAAAAGSLELFVGGSAQDRVAPLLAELTRNGGSLRNLGERAGAGQTAKLLANLLWFAESVAVTEALLIGREAGLDVRALRAALAGSAGDSVFLRRHADALLAGDDLTDFSLPRVLEELEVVDELAGGVPHPLHRRVLELHREALAEFGPVDGELMAARLLERRAGRPLTEPGVLDHRSA